MAASAASVMISVEPNQSLVSPRSSMSWKAPRPSASTPKPNQSNLRLDCDSPLGRKVIMPSVASTPKGRFT